MRGSCAPALANEAECRRVVVSVARASKGRVVPMAWRMSRYRSASTAAKSHGVIGRAPAVTISSLIKSDIIGGQRVLSTYHGGFWLNETSSRWLRNLRITLALVISLLENGVLRVSEEA